MGSSLYGSVKAAAEILRAGGVVAYPTEACFGLGCDPCNAVAVRRILTMKKRSWDKGLILIADRIERLLPYLEPGDPSLLDRILGPRPDPVSWVCPASPGVPRLVRGEHRSIAVRVTAHPPAARLCRAAAMALVSTSANVAGQAPLKSAGAVAGTFGSRIDLVVDARIGRASRPSTIIDALSGEVLRS